MRHVKALGMAMFAMLVMSATATAVASAELLFNASGMGTLTGSATQTQTITTSAGSIECSSYTLSGPAVLHLTEYHITEKTSDCSAFGLSATMTDKLWLVLSDGLFHLLKSATVSAGFGLCTVTIPPQLLKKATYTNSSGKVKVAFTLEGFTSSGEGICEYSQEGNGTYTGEYLLELPGGTFEA